jgi:hypothetical protein
MDPIGACGLYAMNLVTKSREIGGQNGWGDDYSSHGLME